MLPTTQQQIYIMNPITRRSIVIGGRVYNKLVKDGHVDPDTNQFINQEELRPQKEIADEPVVVAVAEEEEYEEPQELEQLVEKLTGEKVDKVRLSNLVAEASKNVMMKYKDDLNDIDDDEELYMEVKNLINAELKILLEI